MNLIESVDTCGNFSSTFGGLTFGSTRNNNTFEQAKFDVRMKSFETWPRAHPISALSLCHAGFQYTGQSDKVKCYKCGILILNFEATDIPWIEHQKFSPMCELVKMMLPTTYAETLFEIRNNVQH